MDAGLMAKTNRIRVQTVLPDLELALTLAKPPAHPLAQTQWSNRHKPAAVNGVYQNCPLRYARFAEVSVRKSGSHNGRSPTPWARGAESRSEMLNCASIHRVLLFQRAVVHRRALLLDIGTKNDSIRGC
jgi:hypothetical protein